MTQIKLIAHDESLYIANADIHDADVRAEEAADAARYGFSPDSLLMVRYASGDADRAPWPLVQDSYWVGDKGADALRSALYDAREMGLLAPDARAVTLPDGSTFAID